MKVLIQKPDLDTCLTALILGVCNTYEVLVSRSEACRDDIDNPAVLCVEAGGSGLVHLNNFDHHDTGKYFPPACRQAYDHKGLSDAKLERLVEYVCMVDERPQQPPKIGFPSLSNIFSGMLLLEKDAVTQFFRGIGILKKVLDDNLDPFSTMPDIEEWRPYVEAKNENIRGVAKTLAEAEYFTSNSGLKVGFVQSDFIGGIGALYMQGCDVVIMYNPAFGEPPTPKYTVAGNSTNVGSLVASFDKLEKGWGGRETIIGSPRGGTRLGKEEVLSIVLKIL